MNRGQAALRTDPGDSPEVERLRGRIAELEEELAIKNMHLEIATDGVWDWDLETDHEYMSPRFWRNFGYDPADKPHHPSAWQEIIHPDDAAVAVERFEEHVEHGTPYSLNVRYRHADGHWAWVICRGEALRDDAGKPVRVLGCHQDITELKRIEAELARKSAELESFASLAAHDLQEPLRAIVSFAQLLSRRHGEALDDEGREFVEFILGAGQRMQSLIRDLLALAQASSGQIETAAVDLGELVDGVRDNLRIALDDVDGAIEVQGSLPTVLGDPTLLAMLLQNLASNALKFRSDAAPRIRVSATREHDGWRIAVSDNGIGIEPQHQERIFRAFSRLHSQESIPGTGIGLALCKIIVARHGGWLDLESAVGEGSTFSFILADASRPVRDEQVVVHSTGRPEPPGGSS